MLQLIWAKRRMSTDANIYAYRNQRFGIHLWVGAVFTLALLPLLRHLHLPVTFDYVGLGTAYWLVLAAQSMFVASLLYLIAFPSKDTLRPMLQRFRDQKLRVIFVLIFFVALAWAFTWLKSLVLTVDTIALLELRERVQPHGLRRALVSILPPAAYLFCVFLLVFAYNDIIVSVRFFGAADPTFNAMDQWLLRGVSVSDLCHWALRTFPVSFFRFLEFIYFGMFPQIGAALILCSLVFGTRRGVQLVGAIAMAYYLALCLFFLWPSQGPYYLCPIHFTQFPETLRTYSAQKGFIAAALALWHHVPRSRISFDYFVAFPCMHIAQPLIVMWFLRPWKRMVIALATYDAMLLVAIVLLEWHYVVDILGGVLVAVLAVALVDGPILRTKATHTGLATPA
jgi:hypothetical protein